METRLVMSAVLGFVVATSALAEDPYEVAWSRQVGTSTIDYSDAVAVDGDGNVYMTGTTFGVLSAPSAGGVDVFLTKYDSEGALQWTRQLGSTQSESGYAVAVDGDGFVYISGESTGDLGGPHEGGNDAFLAKYDTDGTLQWTRKLGTTGLDGSYGVAVDSAGFVYMSGATTEPLGGPVEGDVDAFLAKYDGEGTHLWTRQFSEPGNHLAYAMAAGGDGSAYITGTTSGLGGPSAGGDDAFLAKFDGEGTLLWTRQLGSTLNEAGRGVAVDGAGNVYITGETSGNLAGPRAGGRDAFLARYDADGTLLWSRQLGTSGNDDSRAVALDGDGAAYIAGETAGRLGAASFGSTDAFVTKYDPEGTLLWTWQMGTAPIDGSYGVAVSAAGDVYTTGATQWEFGGPRFGNYDAFLFKLSPPSCRADLDGDGQLTIFDFLEFQNLFDAGDLAADFDGDGVLTLFDFLEFQNEFDAGCE